MLQSMGSWRVWHDLVIEQLRRGHGVMWMGPSPIWWGSFSEIEETEGICKHRGKTMWGPSKKAACKPSRGAPGETDSDETLLLDFQPPELSEINFYWLRLQCVFCYVSPSKLMQPCLPVILLINRDFSWGSWHQSNFYHLYLVLLKFFSHLGCFYGHFQGGIGEEGSPWP